MSRPTVEERLISGVVGALFGAVIGFVLGWLCGVYSMGNLMPSVRVDMGRWILVSSGGFAVLGLIIGSDIGTVIGVVFDLIYKEESRSGYSEEMPGWAKALLVVALLVGLWYWLAKG